jgi:hypothetical protein
MLDQGRRELIPEWHMVRAPEPNNARLQHSAADRLTWKILAETFGGYIGLRDGIDKP